MVNTKSAIFCDRRVFAYKGKWENPNERQTLANGKVVPVYRNIFYFISKELTLVPTYKNGRETLTEELEITVFGGLPIVEKDYIYLDNGTKYYVENITPNYLESNILVRDMVKPRISSMVLTLR